MNSVKCQHNEAITQFCISERCCESHSSGCPTCMQQYHNHHNGREKDKTIINASKINLIVNNFIVDAAKPKCRSLQQAVLSSVTSMKQQLSNFMQIVGKSLMNRIGYPFLSKHNQTYTFKRLKNKQFKKVTGKQLRQFYQFSKILQTGNEWVKKENQIYAQQVKSILPLMNQISDLIIELKTVAEKYQITNFGPKISPQQANYGIEKIQQLVKNIQNRRNNGQQNKLTVKLLQSADKANNNSSKHSKALRGQKAQKLASEDTDRISVNYTDKGSKSQNSNQSGSKKRQRQQFQQRNQEKDSKEKKQQKNQRKQRDQQKRKLKKQGRILQIENQQGPNRSRNFTECETKPGQKYKVAVKKQNSFNMATPSSKKQQNKQKKLKQSKQLIQHVQNKQHKVQTQLKDNPQFKEKTRQRKPSIQGSIDIKFGAAKKQGDPKQEKKAFKSGLKKSPQLENSIDKQVLMNFHNKEKGDQFQRRRKQQQLDKSNYSKFKNSRRDLGNQTTVTPNNQSAHSNQSNQSNHNQDDIAHTLLPEGKYKKSSTSSFNDICENILTQRTIIVEVPTHTKDDHSPPSQKPKTIGRNFSLIRSKTANQDSNNQDDQDILFKDDEEKSLLLYIKSLTVSQKEAIPYLESAVIYSKLNVSAAEYLSFLYLKFDQPKECFDICCNVYQKIKHSKEGPQMGINIIINKTAALNIMGRYSETVKIVEKYLILKKHEKLYKNLGDALMNLGKYHDAIKNYQYAIKLKDNFDEACYNLAACYYIEQNYLMAKTMIVRALAKNSTNQEYLQLKKHIFSKLKVKE